MDSLITAAARALASGDALGALNYVALREDPAALAVRGIAMARLGDLSLARQLLRRAVRAFGTKDAVARARCATAEAEIALVSRDLGWPSAPLESAIAVLERHGDLVNAAHARCLMARYLLLIGRVDEVERLLGEFDPGPLPVASRAAHELVVAGVAARRLKIKIARAAMQQARLAASQARIPSLSAEVETAARTLDMPAARLLGVGQSRTVQLDDIETLLASPALVVDACRHMILRSGVGVPLGTRPVLFALVRALAEAWPNSVSRAALLTYAFRARTVDESHRARLRVEIGRLRKTLRDVASIVATKDGFRLVVRGSAELAVLAPLAEDAHAPLLALLADGEAWSSSSLALALGVSQRTVQRALDTLVAEDKVQTVGGGRARRWIAPPVLGFPTVLLLSPTLASV